MTSLSFEFFSSLSGEQQAKLGSKWLQDPASAAQEAADLAASAGYDLSAETIEAAVGAYLGDDKDVDVELKPELMAAVSGGRSKSSSGGGGSSSSGGRK